VFHPDVLVNTCNLSWNIWKNHNTREYISNGCIVYFRKCATYIQTTFIKPLGNTVSN